MEQYGSPHKYNQAVGWTALSPLPWLTCPSYNFPQWRFSRAYVGVAGAKLDNTCPQTSGQYPVEADCGAGGFAKTGILFKNSAVRFANILDGTTNTLMVGELAWPGRNGDPAWIKGVSDGKSWSYAAVNIRYPINFAAHTSVGGIAYNNDISLGSIHPGGCNFCLGDGSVTFINQTVDMDVYWYLSSRAGGELAQVP